MMKNFEMLLKIAKTQKKMRLAVAGAQDVEVLIAVENARNMGLIEGTLVGDVNSIKEIAAKCGINLENYELVEAGDMVKAARSAVSLVSSGKADFLMKGMMGTADLLRAVLDRDIGLRTNNLLSHVMAYSVPTYHKLLFLTDGGMVTYPDLQQKVQIIKSAVKLATALGVEVPKVAPLCAVEMVNTDMQSTVDAALLTRMNQRGQIGGCVIDGPISLDIAINAEAARHKGVVSPVAGDADILLVPNIESGNLLGKALTYFAGAKSAGVIMGAKCPIVLVSRADTHETKLYSIALGNAAAGCR